MPSFKFMITALLLSCLPTLGCAETVLSNTIPVNDLWRHCSFDLNGNVYNLCPLMGSTKDVEVAEELQDERSDSGRYVLALGGFGKESGVGKYPGCNEETWVCFTTSMHERSQPVVQNGRSSNLDLIVRVRGNPDHGSSQLQMTFHGAKKDLDIVMLCSDIEQVELIHVDHDELRFVWVSRHGCPVNSTSRHESKSAWTNEEQEPSDDDGEGDDELLPSDNRKARTGIAFVITSIVLIIICGSAFASSARARHVALGLLRKVSYAVVPVLAKVGLKLQPLGQSFNSLTSKAISGVRFKFRPGGDDLVRWAQEDMALESDIMVNGSAKAAPRLDEESWDGSDEYIPLTTGSRFGTGRRIPSYGSTPEAPTSQEGAVISRMRNYFKI